MKYRMGANWEGGEGGDGRKGAGGGGHEQIIYESGW